MSHTGEYHGTGAGPWDVAAERLNARLRVCDTVEQIRRAEQRLGREPAAAADKIGALELDLEVACRDLVNLVDDSPPGTWPEGWKLTPDEVKP